MIQRCHNPDNPSYEHYGERGITVCLRWRESFEAFVKDMGEKPKESWSLDRVDNDKGYTPQNTRWASPKQQATNNRAQRYLEYKDERWRLCDLAEYAGLKPTTLSSRIDKMGLSVEEAMSKKLNIHTKTRNVYKQKAEELGIHEATLRYRVSKYGWHIALNRGLLPRPEGTTGR